jgi:hypothetical protein
MLATQFLNLNLEVSNVLSLRGNTFARNTLRSEEMVGFNDSLQELPLEECSESLVSLESKEELVL